MAARKPESAGPESPWDYLLCLAVAALLVFSWRSTDLFVFNALSGETFIALCVVTVLLAWRYPLRVGMAGGLAYLAWATVILAADALSGEFFPAFARDLHWLLLPPFAMLLAQGISRSVVLRQGLPFGAAVSVLWIVLLFVDAAPGVLDWFYPPVFGHVRHLSMTSGVLAILLYSGFHEPRLIGGIYRVARVVALAMLFWSGGRGALVAAILAIGIFLAFDRDMRRSPLLYAEIVLALLLAYFAGPEQGGGAQLGIANSVRRTVSADGANALLTGRITIWTKSYEALLCTDRFWFGAGGNGFIRLGLPRDRLLFHPHNVGLQMLLDWGLVGLMVTLGAAFRWLVAVRRVIPGLSERTPDKAGLALILFLGTLAMVDGALYHLEHLIYFACGLALLTTRSAEANGIRPVPVVILVVALLLAASVHFVMLDYAIPWRFSPLGAKAC